jgi:hypothetical protein
METNVKEFNKAEFARFNKGDVLICWLKGASYGDKFTVLEDTGCLTLLCHKFGTVNILNYRDGYELVKDEEDQD